MRKLSKYIIIYFIGGLAFLQVKCTTSDNSDTITKHKWENGDIYTGENGWVEAHAGTMPVVISAPHGGTKFPEQVPDRTCKDIVTVRDSNVIQLALSIKEEMKEELKVSPYLILGRISRKKIDFNRDIQEATCGNAEAKPIWHQYQNYIKEALADAVEKYGKVLFIDLHGHGHDKQRLELGYTLTKAQVRASYLNAETTNQLFEESSLQNLMLLNDMTKENAGINLKKLLTGQMAFGTLMANEGIPAVPSKQDPYPLNGDKYFTGGYITRTYTSSAYPNVFGWQIESNYKGVRDGEESYENFGRAFTKAIKTFIDNNR